MNESRTRTRRSVGFTLLVVGIVLMAIAAPAAVSAAPSIDTSTTDGTSSTSEVQDNTDLRMNASSQKHIVQAIGNNSTAYDLEIAANSSGVVYAANSSMVNISGPHSEGSHFNGSFTEAQLADMPIAAGGNETLDVTVINESNSTKNVTIQAFYNNTDERSVFAISNQGDVFTNEDEGILDFSVKDFTEVDDVSRSVNGSDTTIFVSLDNASAAEDYSDKVSETDSGDWIVTSVVEVDGEPVPVFNGQAGDRVDDSSDTYAVYETDVGGQPALRVHLGDDQSDASSVEVSAASDLGQTSNLPTSVLVLRTYGTDGLMDYYGGALSFLVLPLGGSMAGFGLILIRPRRTTRRRKQGGR